ncbi:MAG: discoidin domain-containing protein, partial [Phycisphaeraceae bacterium]|nr:discoidin domain-containing protein [Phycisphaeraceae bacterium]
VLRGESLSWVSGEFAVTHNVYVGTSFEDVDAATEPTVADIAANSFVPGLLDYGQTYYWRVDEVNGTPDKTVFKGDVWSFTAEPYSIQIPGSTIAVTASSASNEFSEPGKTLDGSGLDANDMHSINPDTMWFTAAVDLDPWIQYEFDEVKKLDVMKVWNSNGSAESAIGWGVKDVQVEYSVDGEAWEVLGEASQFSRAPGLPIYSQYDAVAFSGTAAKYVRFNIQSNWGGILMAYGLSEVQFSMIPVRARTPEPASGTVDVLPNAVVTWRAGREAAQHKITVSTDPNDLGSTVSSSTNSVDLSSLDLQLDQTYYWRVDEVNESEVPPVWAGSLWSLSTVPYVTVEDFETYGNFSPDRPFQTWLDGFGYSADEVISVGYGGNGTGSGVGHDIWSLSSPQYDGQIMEGSIVKSGQLSMPLYFNNTNGLAVSETKRTFDSPQDWTANGIKSLSLSIYGDPGNSGQLYVKINDTRINYDGLSDALQRRQWIPWNIDLSGAAGNLQNVTSLAIGVEGAGATGMIYVDAIRLYALMPDMINPVVPDDSDPNLFAYYAFEGNANDSAGANHGTTNGDPGYTTGKVGQTMTFDGTDDYVLLTFDQEEVWSAYAVSLWSRTDIFGQVQFRSVFNNSSSDPDFQIDVDGSDPGVYRYWGTQAGAELGPVTSDWVHLAASCDGTETKIYYNGLWVDTLDAVDSNFGRLGIGTNRGTNQPFAGSIDDVRVYNRSLSNAEIAGLAGLTEPIPVSF